MLQGTAESSVQTGAYEPREVLSFQRQSSAKPASLKANDEGRGAAARLQRHPEIGKIFNRYFGLAKFVEDSSNLSIEVPTQFHARKIESLLPAIKDALSLVDVSVAIRPAQKDPNSEGPLFPGASSGHSDTRKLPNASYPSSQHQMHIAMPPGRNAGLDKHKIEKSKRLDAPKLIESPQNAVAVQMARQWAERVNSGSTGQCLWLYGEGGSGKTYMARQLHEWITLGKRLVHVDVASFFQEWRTALNNKDTFRFIQKYRRDTDVLILEDLDDLQGKPGTQKEVLITITALLDRGASVVVSSAGSPILLRELLPEALFSRLFSGYCLDMPKPDRVFKEKLWRSLLEQNGLANWSMDIRITDRILSLNLETPRKVQTYFINAIGRLSLTQKLEMSDLQELEAIHGPRKAMNPTNTNKTPSELIDGITKLCGVSLSALQGNSRRHNITLARRFVCLGLSKFLGLTNVTISQYIEKDPSTVSHALNTLESDLESQRHVAQQWNWICDELGLLQAVR
ncbi:ATP-binding protein [bacterium]|nr:ATP-binding protein [bacterium]